MYLSMVCVVITHNYFAYLLKLKNRKGGSCLLPWQCCLNCGALVCVSLQMGGGLSGQSVTSHVETKGVPFLFKGNKRRERER